MEDQQDVESVTAATSSGNSPSESLVEKNGSENQVEESSEEGDGGEIMVEVVGSDVYVDGVSGDIEGNLEGGDLEDKTEEVTQIHKVSEAMDVSKVGPELKDEKHIVTREEVDVTLCKSVDVDSALPPSGVSVVNDEVWNPGIEAIESSSAATVPDSEVIGPSPMVIVEEKITEAEAVTKDGRTEAVLDEKTEIKEKKEVLDLDQISLAATVQNSEDIGPSPMVIDDEKIAEVEAVAKDGAASESLDRPKEAVLDEKTEIEEKKVLPSSDSTAIHDQFSPAATVTDTEVIGPSPLVISEEMKTEDEAVTKECADLVTPEPLDHPEEAALDEKTEIVEKKEVLPSNDDSAKCAAADEVAGSSPMVISAEKNTEDEVVDKDSAELITPEPISRPAEAVSEIADIEEKEEVVPSSDNPANRDHVDADSVMSHDETMSHPAEAVPQIADTEEKKEVSPSSDNSANRDHVDADSVMSHEATMSHSAEAVSEIADIEENKEVSPSIDNSANRDHVDADSVMSHEETMRHPAEAVSEIADIEENKEVSPSSDNSASRDHVDADSVISHEETKAAQPEISLNPNGEGVENVKVDGIDSVVEGAHLVDASNNVKAKLATTNGDGVENIEVDGIDSVVEGAHLVDASDSVKAELATTDGDGGIDEKSVDEKEAFAAESKAPILESDAQVSDVQDENQGCEKLESDDQVFGVSHTGKDECLRADAELETHKADENQVLSDEPNQLTEKSITDVVDSDKSLNVDIQEDKIKNEPNITSSSVPSDKEIVQAEMDGQDAVISKKEAVDGDGSSEKVEEINSEIPAVDNSAENTELVEEGMCSKVEMEDLMAVEDHANATGNSEGIDNIVQECGMKQEVSEKITETRDGSCEKVEEINSEIPAVDDSAENTELVEEGMCSKVETEDLMAVDDHANAIGNSEGIDNKVQECGTEQEVSEQITETSNHEVGKIENINSMPNEVAPISDTAQVCISPEKTEKAGPVEEITSLDNKSREEDHEPQNCNGFGTLEDHISETKVMDVEEEQESEKSKLSTEETMKCTSSFRMSQLGYLTPPEKEGNFAQSDLVWGKVRSHPWWPGQIFDPDDASEKAVKYHKKDSYLVAYFGDQTFAWNDASALKPFRSHFTQIEKQSSSEAFHNAVTCALEEVGRRVELGLACSCIPKDAYAKIETQGVENTGIREEASQRFGVDKSTRASHFEPDKLLDYITGLAPRASSRPDRLDLVIARAQLSAFCRFKGYRSLTEFPSSGELLESDADTEKVSHKRRQVPKDIAQLKKEKSMVDRGEYSPDAEEDEFGADDFGKSVPSGKKRKALDPLAEGSEKRVTVYAAKVSTSATQVHKPSFKIGECIRRVASQLTGSTPSLKDETVIDGSLNEQSEKQSVIVSAESLSVSEMLSQIELLALNPKKKHGFHNSIRAFFLRFRSSVAINRRGRKKKSEQTVGGSGEEFEFDDVNDSYWTDRIVQNYPDEQLPHEGENGAARLQVVSFSGEKPVKTGRKTNSRKRFSSGVSPTAPTEEDERAKRRKQESSPAELILNFAERNRVPSEISLNKMFRRFGPLMESETEVDHESGCAKVIYKRGSDAEVARNSAEKFNIFGSTALVNYQIGYSPVISVKILPVAMPQLQEDETLMV